MSFHKLKIGSRKKQSNRSIVNSSQKVKDKNEELNLNLETKLHTRKANLISMSDDFNHDIFKLKKHQFTTGSKTDRVHKIERIESGKEESSHGKAYHFSYGNGVENQEYSASQVIDFLNVKPVESKHPHQSMTPRMVKQNTTSSATTYQSQKPEVASESSKPRVHQIKQITPTEVESKVKQAFEIRKKVIELEEQPLNCEIVVGSRVNESVSQLGNGHVAQNNQFQQVKDILNEVIEGQKEAQVEKEVQIEKEISVEKEVQVQKIGEKVHILEEKLPQSTQSQKVINTPERQTKLVPSQQKLKQNSPISQKSIAQQVRSQSIIPSQPVIQNPSQQSINQISPTKSKLSYRPINQVQVTILQQNKLLTQEIQKLRKQRDELQFTTKRYQVQLMQSNCQEYYQREIKRLRNQVQTLQSSQQQLKHNNFILQNKCKQLQSSQQISKREMKRLLKELQVIKIDSTKEKHELKEKSASLQFVIKQLEERNSDLSNKFQDYYKKFNQLEKTYKLKCQEETNLRKQYANLESKLVNSEKAAMEKLKHYENGLNTHSAAKSQLQSEYRQFRRQSQTEIQSLRQNIKQLNLKRQSQALLISSRLKSLQKHNNTIEAQLQVVRLQQTVKQLQTEIHKRSELIRQLNAKIDSMISMKDYEELRRQLELVNLQKSEVVKEYEKEVMGLQMELEQVRVKLQQKEKQVMLLEKEKDNVLCETNKSTNKLTDHSLVQKQNFKQILKQQILQCDSLKHQLFNKSQLHFKLKEQYEEQKIKYDSLRNQVQIMRKQFSSYQNNSKMKKDILEQELVNEIDSMKRKMTVLERRFDSKVKENKEKEQFIKDYIIGNSGNADAQYLVKQLERVFLQKEKGQILNATS